MKVEIFIPETESELVDFDKLRKMFAGETEVNVLHSRNIAVHELPTLIEALGLVRACINDNGTIILSATLT